MTLSPTLRRVILIVALLLLLGLAWTGLSGGVEQLPQAETGGQKAQNFAQLAYGLFGLLSAVTVFWARSWGAVMQGCWAVSITLAAGLASIFWGGTGVIVGLVSGAVALLVALGIVWLLRVGARGLTSPTS